MLIRPSKEIFDKLMSEKDTLYSYDKGDQGMLMTYFQKYLRKPQYKQLSIRSMTVMGPIMGIIHNRQMDVSLLRFYVRLFIRGLILITNF